MQQMGYNAGANIRPFYLAQFKRNAICNMLLLNGRLADVKLPRLTVVVGKTFGP